MFFINTNNSIALNPSQQLFVIIVDVIVRDYEPNLIAFPLILPIIPIEKLKTKKISLREWT